jgi:hypothetical protein
MQKIKMNKLGLKKIFILLLAFFIGKNSIVGQPVYDFPYIVPQYDFIRYDLNKLSFQEIVFI